MSRQPADELLASQKSDEALILEVRHGSSGAYGLLYERHVDSAMATASRYAGNHSDAADLVAEAFANVLQVLQNGKGPDVFFRAYLLTTLRRLASAKRSADEKLFVLDDLERVAPAVPSANTVVVAFENETVARSFRNLPERWQLVLWHTEIDGLAPAAVAPILGMSANAVSALAVRAREGLKQAYLQNHLSGTGTPGCEKYADQLGAYARHGLTARRTKTVQAHVDGCLKCTEKLLYLEDVGVGMRAIIFPALLGLAFAGKGAAIVGGGLGLGLNLGAAADLSAAGAQGAGANGAGAGAAGAAAAGLGLPAVSALVAASVAALVMVGGVVAAAVGVPFFGGPSQEPAAAPQTGSAVTQVAGQLPPAAGATRKVAASATPAAVAADDPESLPPAAGLLPPAGVFLPPAAVPSLDYAGEPDPGPLPSETTGQVTGPSATADPGQPATPGPGPTPVPTRAPAVAPTAVPTPTQAPSHVPPVAPTSSATLKPTPQPTPAPPSAAPTPMPTAMPSPTSDPTPSPTPTLVPSATPTPSPSVVPTPTPTAKPTSDPTVAPTPTPTSSAAPSAGPTGEPTDEPSVQPTDEPTEVPAVDPTVDPTAEPSATPTPEPSATPTASPTAEPSPEPPAEKTQFSVETTDLSANGYGARLQIDLTASGPAQVSAARVAFSSSSWLLHLGLTVQAPSGWTCDKSAILTEPEWVCTVETWAGETSAFVLARSKWTSEASLTMTVQADESDDFIKKLRF